MGAAPPGFTRPLASAPAITPLFYVQFTSEAPVTLTGALTFAFALPTIPAQYGYARSLLSIPSSTAGTWPMRRRSPGPS
jgi:hypothetical protein